MDLIAHFDLNMSSNSFDERTNPFQSPFHDKLPPILVTESIVSKNSIELIKAQISNTRWSLKKVLKEKAIDLDRNQVKASVLNEEKILKNKLHDLKLFLEYIEEHDALKYKNKIFTDKHKTIERPFGTTGNRWYQNKIIVESRPNFYDSPQEKDFGHDTRYILEELFSSFLIDLIYLEIKQ